MLRDVLGSRASATWVADLAGVGLVTLVVLVAYGGLLGRWWTGDDLALHGFVGRFGPVDYLARPDFWQELPWGAYSPLQLLLFEADLALWGRLPGPAYVHLLFWVLASLLSLGALFRLWLPPAIAWGAVSILSLTGGAFAAGQQLMNRHYWAGLAFAALALLAFVVSLRGKERRVLSTSGTALYLAACLAKEVYAPLVLVAAFLPEDRLGRRLRMLWPWSVVLLAYLGLRRAMLGSWSGGYGFMTAGGEWVGSVLVLPGALLRGLFGTVVWWQAVGVLLLAAAVGVVAVRRRRSWPCLLAVGAAILLPLLPVAGVLHPRHLIAVSVGAVAVSALAIHRLAESSRRRAMALSAILGGLVVGAHAVHGPQVAARLERYGAEGRFLLTSGASDFIRKPVADSHFLEAVVAMRGEAGAGGWFADDFYLCQHLSPEARLWEYSYRAKRLVKSTDRYEEIRQRYCDVLGKGPPPSVELRASKEAVSWLLGPDAGGTFSFLLSDGVTRIDVPRRGRFRMPVAQGFALRVRHESEAGEVSITPSFVAVEAGARLIFEERR